MSTRAGAQDDAAGSVEPSATTHSVGMRRQGGSNAQPDVQRVDDRSGVADAGHRHSRAPIYIPPITDGPVSRGAPAVMTVDGTITATAVLFALLLVSATAGWIAAGGPDTSVDGQRSIYQFPALALVGVLVGFGCVLLLYFKPHLAKILGTDLRARAGLLPRRHLEGVRDVLRRHRRAGRRGHDRRVRRDARALPHEDHQGHRPLPHASSSAPRSASWCSTACACLIRLFAGADSISFLASPSLLGIGFSLFVAGLAAMNLALDFDFIDRGVEAGLVEGLRVVRGVRPAGHDRVAVPRDAATAGQAARAVTSAPGADSRGRTPHRRGRDHGRRRCVARRPRRVAVRSVDPTRRRRRDQRRGVRMARHVRLAVAGGVVGVRARLDVGVRHHRRSARRHTSQPRCAATRSTTTS